MDAKRTFRTIRRTATSLAVPLRVLVMAFAIVFSPLGFSFSVCQCLPCECSLSEDVSCGCCCTESVQTNCCSTSCCDGVDCDDFGENEGSECSGNCTLCHCDMGLAVNPEELPGINDAAKPVLDVPSKSFEPIQAWRSSSHRVDRSKVLLTQDFHALHCRWLI